MGSIRATGAWRADAMAAEMGEDAIDEVRLVMMGEERRDDTL